MTRTAMLAAFTLVASCAPARAGAPESKATPVAIATAEPVATATPAAATPSVKEPIQRFKDRMRWIEGPRQIKNARMTTLEGDPKEAGAIYTIRVSIPAGTKMPPHHHPQDERVTVLEGSVNVGFGDVADEKKGTKLKAGDYYVNPAGSHHYVWFDEAATLQITGIGPWDVIPVAPQ